MVVVEIGWLVEGDVRVVLTRAFLAQGIVCYVSQFPFRRCRHRFYSCVCVVPL